ncbi:class A beta-lactamase-related serine hydrolase [Aquiflexum sp. TKW24L]|uniref:serine hydrolase n=1 Tax=Aquiflexum sp. TKW24L TaxID=2942212 RepID=UPI0020C09950|nr:serine hydrolase [Aquiflexum sp. TKW24L]MCL6260155.1 class A beta-lactamase-related serine hydrolase [Aquiflexum sp. TKW24L]
MRLLYFLAVFLLVPPFSFAQKQSLQQVLEKETAGFRGDVGIYVLHLETGEEAAINADTIFPTASVVKVPILVGVMDKIEKGELAYHQKMIYRDSIKYGGSGLMQHFKDSTETELSVLMSLMITYSDNTTSLWCQALAGGGERINEIMESLGLQHTRVNSRTPGREEIWKKYGWGQTTPREMANLLIKIRKGEVISSAASDRMYRLMGNIFYDEYALSAIPAQVQTASKQGMLNASRSELVLVNAPKGDYVFYIATKNNEDQRWEDDNEAQVLQKRISEVLWEWFER